LIQIQSSRLRPSLLACDPRNPIDSSIIAVASGASQRVTCKGQLLCISVVSSIRIIPSQVHGANDRCAVRSDDVVGDLGFRSGHECIRLRFPADIGFGVAGDLLGRESNPLSAAIRKTDEVRRALVGEYNGDTARRFFSGSHFGGGSSSCGHLDGSLRSSWNEIDEEK
jgi:hypothetical protein